MSKNPVHIIQGDSPVILGMPHASTWLPAEIKACLNDGGRLLADTDWHVDRLYDGLLARATVVRANFHRYVIDANRDPSGESLYPGQNTTALVPMTDFAGKPIWRTPPSAGDIDRRRATYHAAYHAGLASEMTRVHADHGIAVLYDCHSIRSRIPYLFDGQLADFNIGTSGGATCAPEIEAAVVEVCRAAGEYSHVVNGRFRGGWTTRHYGQPSKNWHGIQMELAQSTYLASETTPFAYDASKAEALRRHLATILHRLEEVAYTLGGKS